MNTGPDNLTILGSTGSIGASTLDVLARHPERFRVFALTAKGDVETLLGQCRRFRPRYAAMADPEAARHLRKSLGNSTGTTVLAGADALAEIAAATEADCVVAAIVGAAGLLPTLAAVRAGRRVLLANKEALVMAGALFMAEVARSNAHLLPLDSEHNAIYQCLSAGTGGGLAASGVRRILLTASGGPFRQLPLEALAEATPEQACAHPNWAMGRKISVDSATMMNKGLELIEACWLFDTEPSRIQVVIHPQSIVHSLVEYVDGSVLAQLGNPDMRTPIAHALACPERIASGVPPLDLFAVARLDFEPPDERRFPCLRLALEAAASGGSSPAALNAANEVAVAAFLDGRIRFTEIAAVNEAVLGGMASEPVTDLDHLLAVDAHARERAEKAVGRLTR